MSWRRLQNIVLLMLVAVNVCLLAAAAPTWLSIRRQSRALEERLTTWLQTEGIELDTSLPTERTLYELELPTSETAQFTAVKALLGDALSRDIGTYETRWRGVSGTCTVGSAGQWEAALDKPTAHSAATLLSDMGFEVAASLRGLDSLTVWQRVAGVRLFAPLTLQLSDGGVVALSGTFLLYDRSAMARTGPEACCSAADALVAFVAARDALGWVGSSISGIEQGYTITDSSRSRLTPVWHISTDTATYAVDGLSRSVYLVE